MPTTAPVRLDPLQLLLKHDKPVPRYTSYPTAASFHTGVGASELAAELARPSDEDLSLYVHIPFCRHACWYCGCNRITTQAGSKVVGPYLRALARELELIQQASTQRRRLGQLHWGGGTPNYLSVDEQAAVEKSEHGWGSLIGIRRRQSGWPVPLLSFCPIVAAERTGRWTPQSAGSAELVTGSWRLGSVGG